MYKKSLIESNITEAYKSYNACGGNLVEAWKALKRKGIEVSDDTFRDWAEKYNFKARLDRADVIARGGVLGHDDVVFTLKLQLQKYFSMVENPEEPFEANFTNAMLNLVKTLNKLGGIEGAEDVEEAVSQEKLRKATDDILYEEYGIKRSAN